MATHAFFPQFRSFLRINYSKLSTNAAENDQEVFLAASKPV